MSKPITHVLITVDDSASMGHLATDTRPAFNNYVDDLVRDTEQKYRVTVAKFGSGYELLANAQKPKDVTRLNEQNYRARQGSTALYDAIGRLITDFEDNTEVGKEDRMLLVVQTDGQENSSREYTLETVRTMIREREATGRWTCLFLAAGPDAWQQGAGMGFAGHSVIKTQATSAGTRTSYSALSGATRSHSRGADSAEVAEVVRGGVEAGQ